MKKLTALAITSATYLSFVSTASAKAVNVAFSTCANSTAGTNFDTLCALSLNGNVLSNVITLAFVIAALIALAFLIFGGIKWILSGGDKSKVEEARGTIVAALVGLVITFLAYFIINIVFSIFGLGTIQGLKGLPVVQIFK